MNKIGVCSTLVESHYVRRDNLDILWGGIPTVPGRPFYAIELDCD